MDWDQISNAAGSAVLVLACTTFMIVYHLLAPWRKSEIGRHMMTFAAALGLLGLYTVLISICSDGAGATALRVLRTLLVVALAALMAQRTRMVIRAQRSTPADKES